MQYPHQGGYKIQLLDSFGKIIEQLFPSFSNNTKSTDNFDGLENQM